jgi:pyruvate/2-oxoglutarate dehydrogenase complex dihydrolipoamide acyltransferase (E2) component
LNGGYYPYPYIIRAADKKSVVAISQEIDEQINRTVSADDDLYLKNRSKADQRMVKFMLALPSKLRVMLMETMVRNPFRHKQIFGTVGFATVNITGRLSAWVFPNKNAHSLYIALGSITKKPVVVKNEVQVREVLNITAIFNHNVIDGTPARSFMNALVDTIEKGLIDVS